MRFRTRDQIRRDCLVQELTDLGEFEELEDDLEEDIDSFGLDGPLTQDEIDQLFEEPGMHYDIFTTDWGA